MRAFVSLGTKFSYSLATKIAAAPVLGISLIFLSPSQ